MSDAFEAILATASREVTALARQAKALIQDVMPNVLVVAAAKHLPKLKQT